MKRYIVATRKSAALSGALLGFGLPALEAVQVAMRITPDVVQIQFFIALAILFFVPVPFFVFGTHVLAYSYKDMLSKSYWLEMKEVCIRGFCWLTGGGTAFAVIAAIQNLGS